TLTLTQELTSILAEFAQQQGVTPFMILMAALAITLHKWSQQQDLVIGTVVSGRSRREVENLIGCFMNFLPMRAKFKWTEPGQEILGEIRARVLEAQAHQGCPFEKIVEAINPERKLQQNPLYNVALLYQNFEPVCFETEDLQATPLAVEMKEALLDL